MGPFPPNAIDEAFPKLLPSGPRIQEHSVGLSRWWEGSVRVMRREIANVSRPVVVPVGVRIYGPFLREHVRQIRSGHGASDQTGGGGGYHV